MDILFKTIGIKKEKFKVLRTSRLKNNCSKEDIQVINRCMEKKNPPHR